MLCLSGFELYSRWVPLINLQTSTLINSSECVGDDLLRIDGHTKRIIESEEMLCFIPK